MKYRECLENLSAYVPGKPISEVKKELGLETVIKLASNENPLGCSSSTKNAISGVLKNVELYPDGNCTELREALSNFLGTEPESILFGCGTDEVISMLAQTFIEPDDEMITGEVTFSQYEAAVNSIGGRTVMAPMRDYKFDLEAMYGLITPKTKMIFIANPNNPTGTIISADEELEFIKKVPPEILVVIDEAYCDYVESRDYLDTIPLIKQYPNLVVLRTFSKIYGLASLRVGYGIMNPEIVGMADRLRKPFNVNSFAQAAACSSISDTHFIALSFMSNQNTKAYLYKCFDELKLYYIPTQANFIMLDTGHDSNKVFQALMKKGFIIRAGSAFGMPTFIRITIGTMEQMQKFVVALTEVLKEI